MKLVIQTQYMENYGAHDWNGEGTCPQYWKFKGGEAFQVTGLDKDCDIKAVIDCVRDRVEWSNDGSRSYIVGADLVDDNWMSDFERSQLEYDGKITCKEPSISWTEVEQEILGPVFDYEYADWTANLDAQAYGEMQ